jgi:hypothetical protein
MDRRPRQGRGDRRQQGGDRLALTRPHLGKAAVEHDEPPISCTLWCRMPSRRPVTSRISAKVSATVASVSPSAISRGRSPAQRASSAASLSACSGSACLQDRIGAAGKAVARPPGLRHQAPDRQVEHAIPFQVLADARSG